jgi:hypothetical protein
MSKLKKYGLYLSLVILVLIPARLTLPLGTHTNILLQKSAATIVTIPSTIVYSQMKSLELIANNSDLTVELIEIPVVLPTSADSI